MQTQHRHNLGAFALFAAVLLLLAPLSAEALEVTNVAITSRPTNGDTYRTNETIKVTITFDKRARGNAYLLLSGSTSINVGIGANTRAFNYASGSGTTQLVYSYTVQSSDADTDGISVTSINSSALSFISTAPSITPSERLPDAEYALPRNQIANAGPHKVNRSATTGIFYSAQAGNSKALLDHSGVDYRPATALAFDGRNRPYMLSYAVYGTEAEDNRFTITTLRNGEWTTFSFKDELIATIDSVSSSQPRTDRHSEMIIDEHDDLYAVMMWVADRNDVGKFILVYAKNVASDSFNGDFEILELPGKPLLEARMSANNFANYPPLAGYAAGHSTSDPTYPYTNKHRWAGGYWSKLYVLPLRRDAAGDITGMTLADTIRVDDKLGYITTHSGATASR